MNITPEIKAAIIPPLLQALLSATGAARGRAAAVASPQLDEDPIVSKVKAAYAAHDPYDLSDTDLNFIVQLIGIATSNSALASLTFPIPESATPAHDPFTVIVFPSKDGGHGYTVNHPYIVVHGLRRKILDRKGRMDAKSYTENVVLATDEQIAACVNGLVDAQYKAILENDLFAPITAGARALVADQLAANPPPGE